MPPDMIQDVLQQIVRSPQTEARWLNTLSLLEFIGAHKINRTVCSLHPPLDILKHFADEARHAYLFKCLSEELSKGKCKDYLCHDEAVSYFQMLDGTVSEWLNHLTGKNDSTNNYLIVTCLIERRAMKLYPAYKKITKNPLVREELQKVIDDETAHRDRIESGTKELLAAHDVESLDHCLKIEESLFEVFVSSLKKEVEEKSRRKKAA